MRLVLTLGLALTLLGCPGILDTDNDGAPDATDCAPDDPDIYPGAPDSFGDGIDSDCDGCADADAGDGVDADCDGYPANGEGAGLRDCDDSSPDVHPDAEEIPNDGIDQDCDEVDCIDEDLDGFCAGIDDCDDADATVYLGAPEAADCLDHDCDGTASEGTSGADDDFDGSCEGVDLGAGLQCCEVTAEVGDCDDGDPASNLNDLDGDGVDTCSGDCDDGDDDRAPGLPEVCDGKDNDCLDGLPADEEDGDGDGVSLCDGDCDDDDDTLLPGDGDLDGYSTCEGDCDDGDPLLTPVDADVDGFSSCTGDCDDDDIDINPDAVELCDGLDTDCDGTLPADEVDVDGDGYPLCEDCDDDNDAMNLDDVDGDGFSSCEGDCNEGNPGINPFVTDIVGDGIDQNCDGIDGTDFDQDGWASLASGGADCDDQVPELNLSDTDADTVTSCDGDCDDNDSSLQTLDVDGDSWSSCEGDCDDADPALHPHAIEIPFDGVDQSCSGVDYCEDLNCDGWPDIVFANNFSGASAYIDSWIYWGGPDGWSDASRSGVPTVGAGVVELADLDGDGYLDIVFGSHYDLSTYVLDSYVYWGGPAGYSDGDRTSLPTIGASGIGIADLDDDGLLDILYSNYWNSVTVVQDSYLYWGSLTGYSTGDRATIPSVGGWGNDLVDVDGDGSLDIVMANHRDDSSDYTIDSWIYWGGFPDYSSANRDGLPTLGAYGIRAADLNSDGFTDFAVASYWDGFIFDQDSTVFWGSAGGWTTSTALPTTGGAAVSIADLDGDGDDDLLFSCSRSGSNFLVDSLIYWNDAGSFDPSDFQALPTQGAKLNHVADFDQDGYLDIAFANWRETTPNWLVDSYIYWGGPTGFSVADRTDLPTQGAAGVKVAGPGIDHPRSTP